MRKPGALSRVSDQGHDTARHEARQPAKRGYHIAENNSEDGRRSFPARHHYLKHDDDKDDDFSDVCYIGRVISVRRKKLKMLYVSPSGQWREDPEDFLLNLIYRVDFGGGYEAALLRVADAEGTD